MRALTITAIALLIAATSAYAKGGGGGGYYGGYSYSAWEVIGSGLMLLAFLGGATAVVIGIIMLARWLLWVAFRV